MMEKYGYTESEQGVVDTEKAKKQTTKQKTKNNPPTKKTGETKEDVHVKHT